MDELRFILKCFVFSALLLMLTQIKTGELTIEKHIEATLINSKMADFVNNVANGGVKIIKDAGHYANESYLNWRRSEIAVSASSAKVSDIKLQAESTLNKDTGAAPYEN